MIEDIEITNFRCFDRLKVSGFKRVNLISGKNNIGKTALLEAIFLNISPTQDTILFIINSRSNSNTTTGRVKLPEKAFDNLLKDRNFDIRFKIDSVSGNKDFKKISITISDKKKIIDQINKGIITVKETSKENLEAWLNVSKFDDLHGRFFVIISIYVGDDNTDTKLIVLPRDTEIEFDEDLEKNEDPLYLSNVSFLLSNRRSSTVKLTLDFDKARLEDRDDEVLSAFQIIDPSIVAVESFSIPEPTIYLRRQGEKRMPLSLFGDAMNRMADIILKIINNQDSVLLIDEIENGIHHSNQVAFWEFLYKLADRLNVQIFATTHSLEMTRAFLQAGLNQPEISAAHFELTRHEKTNKIVAIERDLETLEYAIDRNKEVRGGT